MFSPLFSTLQSFLVTSTYWVLMFLSDFDDLCLALTIIWDGPDLLSSEYLDGRGDRYLFLVWGSFWSCHQWEYYLFLTLLRKSGMKINDKSKFISSIITHFYLIIKKDQYSIRQFTIKSLFWLESHWFKKVQYFYLFKYHQ